ncbi:MAG: hypothetical protein LBQ44_10375, partial [Treponema sp.]|nr:hypothetical protein [Treponema sp.]
MGELNKDDLYREIFRRKSVRRFEQREPDQALTDRINAAIAEIIPLNDSPAALQVFPADQAGVSFGKAPCCLGVYAQNGYPSQLNAAFMLQEMGLYLSRLGLGSCWLGMAKPKGPLAEYRGLAFSKLIVFGYPGEALYRDDPGQFNRKTLREITDIQGRDELLEAVRLAPSAMNRQGWYLTSEGNKIRLYMAGNHFIVRKLMDPLTTADAGIALCHLWLSASRNACFVSARREDAAGTIRNNYA